MAMREDIERGINIQNVLDIDLSDLDRIIPKYKNLSAAFEFGEVWSNSALCDLDSSVVVLTCLMMHRNESRLEWAIKTAIKVGHSPRAIIEIFLQAGIYAGFPAAESAAELANTIFTRQGLEVDPTSLPEEDMVTLKTEAELMKQRLHGGRSEKDYAAPDKLLTSKLYSLVAQFAYGEIWRRPGLELRYRLITAMVAFIILDEKLSFYSKFSASALNNGFSMDEVAAVAMQTAPYTGVPRALKALSVLEDLA
ncbi:4-carboxymuconolactone decarboxylase [Vibrio crassostreae]|uniref:Carboxymuconolactone decarboxylase-like domain-containing protein n=1 Tax=Vibrio crassostreae TaxID=246167 RepID=A0A822N7U9_9VIBR|nr:carboxymuconolactone decarboxylase family protein [Vibrio crassostreae]MDH5951620.1 carboxymuconolactone decarboxylase family protein [Vibrio crassostreae]TCN04678.1 alkylhydroperoxidase/carboxymuconolactone decarboxylase family protein YurZ [Vibrio crassostreae]TCU06742.1 alkylhydroperoxidase/carboxymuconolactone decarboxylase family protein YurZ [Vibrio crassostreae]CAK2105707.1 4-carboxymuconolactone decarboxylase [Vibrio crassostreae]CAK2884563.1 4-carboxymuconolactone decarboxylase [Vi